LDYLEKRIVENEDQETIMEASVAEEGKEN